MNIIEECMKMTSFGGQAKSLALQAIANAREGDLPLARSAMEEAEKYLHKSHEAHANLLGMDAEQEDTTGGIPVSFFMMHASDHLSSANTVFVLAKELILIYERGR
jgi:Phosphotransferase system cellobiose-specific component IIA